jgi:hypothetical protein
MIDTAEQPSAGDLMVKAIARELARELRNWAGLETRLMDIHSAAKYLDMTEAALRQKAGISIPCIRADGKLRFDRLELDRWIDKAPRNGV